jgi:hypothetical protein
MKTLLDQMEDQTMREHHQGQSPEDKIAESFKEDQVIFVDVLVTPSTQPGAQPGHRFEGGEYVTRNGDVVCLGLPGKCQIKFRLVWSPKLLKSVMFTKGNPETLREGCVSGEDKPCLMIGAPCEPDGCPQTWAGLPFHTVVREPTGQMVSVINDNTSEPGTGYAYQLNVMVTEHGGTPQLIPIDPRIINK